LQAVSPKANPPKTMNVALSDILVEKYRSDSTSNSLVKMLFQINNKKNIISAIRINGQVIRKNVEIENKLLLI
jgi:hypothetical protein